MVTVAVVAILLAVGAPQLRTFVQKQRVDGDLQALSSAIHLARSEALKRSGRVVICPLPSATATSCPTTATQNWSHGWMVFIDVPITGTTEANAYDSTRDTIVQVTRGIRSAAITASTARTHMIFEANGLAIGYANTFSVDSDANSTDAPCRAVVMNIQGGLRTSACGADDTEEEDTNG